MKSKFSNTIKVILNLIVVLIIGAGSLSAQYNGGTADGYSSAGATFDFSASIYGLSESGISISPNPTNNEIIIDFPLSERHWNITKLEITDITGKTIYINQYTIYNNQLQVDLSSFESGIYIISVKTDYEVFTSKIVKK